MAEGHDLHTELTVLAGLALRIEKLQREMQRRLSNCAKQAWDERPEIAGEQEGEGDG